MLKRFSEMHPGESGRISYIANGIKAELEAHHIKHGDTVSMVAGDERGAILSCNGRRIVICGACDLAGIQDDT